MADTKTVTQGFREQSSVSTLSELSKLVDSLLYFYGDMPLIDGRAILTVENRKLSDGSQYAVFSVKTTAGCCDKAIRDAVDGLQPLNMLNNPHGCVHCGRTIR